MKAREGEGDFEQMVFFVLSGRSEAWSWRYVFRVKKEPARTMRRTRAKRAAQKMTARVVMASSASWASPSMIFWVGCGC